MRDLAACAQRPAVSIDMGLDEERGPTTLEDGRAAGELVGAVGGQDGEEGVCTLWGLAVPRG